MHTFSSATRHRISLEAFSLIEVVIAIAILSFILLVVIGMLGMGLSNNHDSSSRLQAANIASLLISTRRTEATNSNLANFALPALGAANSAGQNVVSAMTNYTKVQTDGTSVTSGTQGTYNLRYIVTASGSQTNIANVDLVLWWPATLAASAATLPVNNPSAYYEIVTQITLP